MSDPEAIVTAASDGDEDDGGVRRTSWRSPLRSTRNEELEALRRRSLVSRNPFDSGRRAGDGEDVPVHTTAAAASNNPFDDDDDGEDDGGGRGKGEGEAGEPTRDGAEAKGAASGANWWDEAPAADGGGDDDGDGAGSDASSDPSDEPEGDGGGVRWASADPPAPSGPAAATDPFDDGPTEGGDGGGGGGGDGPPSDAAGGGPTPGGDAGPVARPPAAARASTDGGGPGPAPPPPSKSRPRASSAPPPSPPRRPPRLVPWQVKWKRPEVHPLSADGDGVPPSPRSRRGAREDPTGAAPVSASSARLTPVESRRLTAALRRSGRGVGGGGGVGGTGGGRSSDSSMRWDGPDDDLGVGGPEDEARGGGEEEEVEEDCALTVTVLASPSAQEAMGGGVGPGAGSGSELGAGRSGLGSELGPGRATLGSAGPPPVGDVLLLEATASSAAVGSSGDQDSEGGDGDGAGAGAGGAKERRGVRLLLSESLRWPSSALVETLLPPSEEEAEDRKSPGWGGLLGALRLGPPRRPPGAEELRRRRERDRGRRISRVRRNAVGVASAALCRRRGRRCGENEDEDDDGRERAFDALDTLRMLGMGSVHDVEPASVERYGLDEVSNVGDKRAGGESSRDLGDEADDDESELVLCCLSSDGKVHFFGALDLLLGDVASRAAPEEPQESMVDGFASFLLGEDLHTKVRDTILPLSRPEATVPLSVITRAVQLEETKKSMDPITEAEAEAEAEASSERKQSADSADKDGEDGADVDATEGQDTPHVEEAQDARPGFVHVDLSLFDATVEPGTARYRTVRNVPTVCAPAFDYVAVGGRGVRRMRRRRRRVRGAGGRWSSISLRGGDAVAGAGAGPDSPRPGARAAGGESGAGPGSPRRGGGGGDGDGGARAQSSRPAQALSSRAERVAYEWEDVYVPGGFVTFVSLRHRSEARTVFLPFVPTRISPVVWDGGHYAVVLGEGIGPGPWPRPAPRATAVRVDYRPAPSLAAGAGLDPIGGADADTDSERAAAAAGGGADSERAAPPPRPRLSARRFAPLPVLLPTDRGLPPPPTAGAGAGAMRPLSLSVTSMLTSPPSVAVVYGGVGGDLYVCLSTLSGLDVERSPPRGPGSPRGGGRGGGGGAGESAAAATAVVRTAVCPGHFAHIPAAARASGAGAGAGRPPAWCVSGQGWSLVGVGDGNMSSSYHFISWEGATATYGAYVQRLQGGGDAPPMGKVGARVSRRLPHLVVCDVLPTEISVTMRKNRRMQDKSGSKARASPVNLPFTEKSPFTKSFKMPPGLSLDWRKHGNEAGYTDLSRHGSGSFHDDIAARPELVSGVDDIIITALDSITGMKTPEYHHDPRALFSATAQRPEVTHRAKSIMLLRHCSSWTQLDDNEENRALIDGQVIVASLRFGPTPRHYRSLTLRKNVITNGIATPFQQVLSWLCQRKDYFTAASVALNLLNDLEAVRDLRGCPSGVEGEEERSYLEGLLDGIIPLDGSDFSGTDLEIAEGGKSGAFAENVSAPPHSPTDKSPQCPSTVTSLADMAVGCLIRGGTGMSQTLEGFLGRNVYYDASRACLMLAATAANAISDQNEMNALSQPERVPSRSIFRCENPKENIIWPIRCLFKIATTRDCMATALLLLNATIPNELRCRESRGDYGMRLDSSRPSLDLCKSIITMIISSSPSAAGYLLSLTDEDLHTRYWQSLDHDTQLALSMISIEGKYSLLREAEVRAWAVEQVSMGIASAARPSSAAESIALSSEWLKEMCAACLSNAGCNLEELLSLGPTSPRLRESADSEDDEIELCRAEMEHTYDALASSPESGGLDFDLIIPALLLLKNRSVQWNDGASLSTQSLLNAICDLAGRQTAEEPSFAFDGVTVMKQCAMAENVLAAANLIGGEDGLVLHCSDVLIKFLGLSMKQAESVLLKKGVLMDEGSISRSDSGEQISSDFELTDGHRYLLWLIEERVLSVKTFGQFEPSYRRGGIDPVFAARVCLRAWLCLNQTSIASSSTWLMSWFRRKLGIRKEGGMSKKRLACAALCRALLWPDDADLVDWNHSEGNRAPVLAEALGFECKFLVDLAQACCGLIEAIPVSVAEEVLNGGHDLEEGAFSGRTIQV